MAVKRTENRKGSTRLVGALLFCAAVTAAVLFFTSGETVYKSTGENAEVIRANVGLLQEYEQREPADLNAAAKARAKADREARKGIMVDDLDAEKEKILKLEGVTKGQLKKRFRGAVICGDSIAEGITGYGWLGTDAVYAKIGIRVTANSEVVQNAAKTKPSVMFLVFGMNDIENYKSKYETFIERYTECIENVRKISPDTLIYVHAVFPPKAIGKMTFYKYLDDYNEALQRMCEELNVFYIDGSFILKAKPELYEPDWIHMERKFYPLWLTYLADVAGLNTDAE